MNSAAPAQVAQLDLPRLGVGIGLRRRHFQDITSTTRTIDWLEFTPENYMAYGGRPLRVLDACRERWTMVPHGVAMNLGGLAPLDTDYFTRLKAIADRVDAPWFSDHLCWNGTGNVRLHELLPLPRSREAVSYLAGRIQGVRRIMGRPILIENISYYANMPGDEMSEVAFLGEILEQADCGLLLDINNVYVNAHNHGFDPLEYLDQLPLHRVVQVHVAGHDDSEDLWIDTHGETVKPEVWSLLRWLISRIGDTSVLLERDSQIPPLDDLLDELDHARRVLEGSPRPPIPLHSRESTHASP